MVMTIEEAKSFIMWLRANGVQQCSYNGLTVLFLPKAVRCGDLNFTVTERADIEPELRASDLEEMFNG